MTAPTGKVMTAAEAVADIGDGASVGIAGFGLSHRYPSTLIAALGEKGSRGLTVYCNGLGQPGFPTGRSRGSRFARSRPGSPSMRCCR